MFCSKVVLRPIQLPIRYMRSYRVLSKLLQNHLLITNNFNGAVFNWKIDRIVYRSFQHRVKKYVRKLCGNGYRINDILNMQEVQFDIVVADKVKENYQKLIKMYDSWLLGHSQVDTSANRHICIHAPLFGSYSKRKDKFRGIFQQHSSLQADV